MFFGVYAIVQNLNVPLIVQPQLLSLLSYMSWAQVRFCPLSVRGNINALGFLVPILWEEEVKSGSNRYVRCHTGCVGRV